MNVFRPIFVAALFCFVSFGIGLGADAQTAVQNGTHPPLSEFEPPANFDPVKAYQTLNAEQKANLAARIPQLRLLADSRAMQANAADAQLDGPNTDCAQAKTQRDCIEQKIELYKEVGEPAPPELQAQLDTPTVLRQDATRFTAVADATEDLEKGKLASSFKAQGSYMWKTFLNSWKFLIQKDELIAFGVGTAGYFAAQPFRSQTDAYFNSHKLTGSTYTAGLELGLGYTLFVPAWLVGEMAQNDKVVRLADDWMVGTLVGGVFVEAGKYGFHQMRPDRSDNLGLPSGHAEESSMMCTLTGLELGWKWGVPACMLAGFVDWTRIQSAKHSPGQVALGTGIGVAAALAVFSAGNQYFHVGQAQVHYTVSPMYVPQTGESGVAYQLNW